MEVRKQSLLISVVDTHPESSHSLRIDQPFPALAKYARELNLDNMDSMEHSHVPFVVLLVKAAAEWKDSVCWQLEYGHTLIG